MEKENTENYFSWPDSWVFTALYYSNFSNKNIDFKNLIAAGDVLNHAILTSGEIKDALIKLQNRGIIKISGDMVEFTDCGKELVLRIQRVKGGLFSRIDISLQELNSKRNRLQIIETIDTCDFITDELINKAYDDYRECIK